MKQWWVYIVQCDDNTFYTGSTNDLTRRLSTHNSGKGAKYTRPRQPVALVFSEQHQNRSHALKREWEIKQKTRTQKIQLIQQSNVVEKL